MKRAVRAAKYIAITGMLTAGGIGACNSDDSNTLIPGNDAGSSSGGSGSSSSGGGNPDTGTATGNDAGSPDTGVVTSEDSGGGTPDSSGGGGDDATIPDASDAATAVDAADSAVGPSFCQSQTGLDFCDDFDLPSALSLDAGVGSALAWTGLVGSPTELALSTAKAKSAPDSLLVLLTNGALPDGGGGNGDQSAKVVKMVTPVAGVTQAIYEFDMYIDTVPLDPSGMPGGFATDFQFDDNGGADRFGFRIGVFANSAGFDHAELQHNHPNLGGNDDVVSSIPITSKAWNHVKMVVAFSATAFDAGNGVHFQLFTNGSATAAVDELYPASFAKAPFARFAAGMVYAFDGTWKNWGIYYDNFTLKVQ